MKQHLRSLRFFASFAVKNPNRKEQFPAVQFSSGIITGPSGRLVERGGAGNVDSSSTGSGATAGGVIPGGSFRGMVGRGGMNRSSGAGEEAVVPLVPFKESGGESMMGVVVMMVGLGGWGVMSPLSPLLLIRGSNSGEKGVVPDGGVPGGAETTPSFPVPSERPGGCLPLSLSPVSGSLTVSAIGGLAVPPGVAMPGRGTIGGSSSSMGSGVMGCRDIAEGCG